MKNIINLIIVTSFLFLLNSCTNQVNDLRQKVIKLTNECKPAVGTPINDLDKLWDRSFYRGDNLDSDSSDTSLTFEMSISPSGHPGILEYIHLNVTYNKQNQVIDSLIELKDVSPNSILVGEKVYLPTTWTEKTFLEVSIRWLELLKKKLDQKKLTIRSSE